ncbi:hypothetical protein SLA2020_123600 [Shorea laevis]
MKRKSMEGNRKDQMHAVDDEEEQKISAFFALVKNFRDAHTQLSMGCKDSKETPNEKPKATQSSWTPSFQWEDFADDPLLRNELLKLSSTSKNEGQCKTEGKAPELDLNLSL